LRVRRAALELGVPVIEVAARRTSASGFAAVTLQHRPGECGALVERLARAAGTPEAPTGVGLGRAAELLAAGDGEVVVVLGRPSLAEPPGSIVQAASALAGLTGVRFLSALRRGNVHGALDLGLAPGFLPGRVSLPEGAAHFTAAWGAVPTKAGRDVAGILAAAAEGDIDVLVLLGCDVINDF